MTLLDHDHPRINGLSTVKFAGTRQETLHAPEDPQGVGVSQFGHIFGTDDVWGDVLET
jgi:hypothetical protein